MVAVGRRFQVCLEVPSVGQETGRVQGPVRAPCMPHPAPSLWVEGHAHARVPPALSLLVCWAAGTCACHPGDSCVLLSQDCSLPLRI